MNKEDKGLRHNEGKTRHDLSPPFAQEQYARVLTAGSLKYSDNNWKKGMRWSKVIASLERHLQALKSGEDHDKETGILHAAHVMVNAAFLTEYYQIYPEGDDRDVWWKRPIKRVWLDIDGVLADFEKHFLETINFNPDQHPNDWYDFRFREYFSQVKGDHNFWLNIPRIFDPKELDYPIAGYCTARPVPDDLIKAWLKDSGFPTLPLINVGEGGKKSDVLKDKCDIFVDDSIMNFWDCQSNGIACYLMTRPHNAKYNVGHWRVNNIKEFLSKLK